MKIVLILGTVIAAMALPMQATPAEDVLTNHIAASAFLDEFELLAGTNFNANLPFEDHYHFDCGRKLLQYIDTHKDDTNIATRVVTLAKSWANMERANEEMRQDQGSRLAHLWFTRTHFAWAVLMKNNMIHEGMKYKDAVALLGKPRKHRDNFETETEVMWVLGGGLRTQTWIRARVDSDGIVQKLSIRYS